MININFLIFELVFFVCFLFSYVYYTLFNFRGMVHVINTLVKGDFSFSAHAQLADC